MAYMSQENKAKLALEIAKVMPKNWKYSLRVLHHSTLVLTIRQAPVDLICKSNKVWTNNNGGRPTHIDLNVYHLGLDYSGKLLKTFEAIKTAMMIGNHDRSELQSDYFDVGWYIDINIGDWKSPFRFVPTLKQKFPLTLADSYKVSHGACSGTDHPFILPNGNCRDCGVFVTSVPGLVQGHTLVQRRPKGMPEGLGEAGEMEWMKHRIAQLEGRV